MAALARPVAAAESLIFGCVPANSVHWIAGAAVEQGFFKNVGFDAEIGVIQSSPRSMQMLITGAYQISSTQPESAIAAIERGASMLAAIAAPMNRADWVLAGAKGIRSLADLKGMVIGVSSLRISEVWLTTQLLERAGLKKDEVSFIGVGTSPLKITAPLMARSGLQAGIHCFLSNPSSLHLASTAATSSWLGQTVGGKRAPPRSGSGS
jgi:ABC-type nitrate/sulfonate/bicarbonate transport system substrate-binding protein